MTDHGQLKPPVKTKKRTTVPSQDHPSSEASLAAASVQDIGERDASDREEPHGEGADPSDCLLRALSSKAPREKRLFAQLGLDAENLDQELEALLLRQLYLAELEDENDDIALSIAEEIIELGTLGDIARQDAARAALALGELEVAAGHLRIAARICPAGRRSFHYCHLGVLLRLDHKHERAVEAFRRAARWATTDRAMYQAILALAETEEKESPSRFLELRRRLEEAGAQKGYDLWVLGELALRSGDLDAARTYLNRFLERQENAPRAKSLSLCGEITHARQLLLTLG